MQDWLIHEISSLRSSKWPVKERPSAIVHSKTCTIASSYGTGPEPPIMLVFCPRVWELLRLRHLWWVAFHHDLDICIPLVISNTSDMFSPSFYRLVTCLAKVSTLLIWYPRVQTTVAPLNRILLVFYCCVKLLLATCESLSHSHHSSTLWIRHKACICSNLHDFTFFCRHELKAADYVTKLPKGKHSTKGELNMSH